MRKQRIKKRNNKEMLVKKDVKIKPGLFKKINYKVLWKKASYKIGIIPKNTMIFVLCIVLLLSCMLFTYNTSIFTLRSLGKNLAFPEDITTKSLLLSYLPLEYYGKGSGELSVHMFNILQSKEPSSYEVKKGDTLSEIASIYNISVGTLIGFNGIEDVRRIIPGMVMKVPHINGIPYIVSRNDTLSSISIKYNIPVNDILDANNLFSDKINPGKMLFIPGGKISDYEYKKATGTLFIYPANGRLSSPYGYRSDPFTGKRRFHYGIDLASTSGTKIISTMSGIVADVGNRPLGFGKYVIIRHANGYQTLYGHLSKCIVRKGQRVSQGEKIGEMGNTGRSTGNHLHFAIYKNNSPVNPLRYLYK